MGSRSRVNKCGRSRLRGILQGLSGIAIPKNSQVARRAGIKLDMVKSSRDTVDGEAMDDSNKWSPKI